MPSIRAAIWKVENGVEIFEYYLNNALVKKLVSELTRTLVLRLLVSMLPF